MVIKCEVIQDLLPSYIDGLTSDESNELIEEHLNKYCNCKLLYNDMIQGEQQIYEVEKEISDKNEIKLMKRIKNKIVTVIITLVVTFSALGFIVGSYGDVLFQEGNPIPLISSIIKLETSNTEYVQYSPNKYISESEPGVDRHKTVIDFMQEKGWLFKEQMGSGLVFEKDKGLINIGTRKFTRHYFVWSIPEQETVGN